VASRAIGRLDAPAGTPLGTCFAVADQWALTAFHCVGDRHAEPPVLRCAQVVVRIGGTGLAATVDDFDAGLDVALLRLADPLPVGIAPVMLGAGVGVGDWFESSGYPAAAADDELDAWPVGGHVTSVLSSFRSGAPAIAVTVDGLDHQVPLHGMSGAPVLVGHASSRAVAILRYTVPADDQTGVALGNTLFATPMPVVAERFPVLRPMLEASQDSGGGDAPGSRLRSYLAAARAVASRHPYPIAVAGAPPLAAVYLNQKLGARTGQAATDTDLGTGEDVTTDRIRQAVARLDIRDVLDCHWGALVVGPPGSGKSSLLRHLVSTVASEWGGPGHPDFVPVLVHARSLLGPFPFHQAIAEAIRDDLGAHLDDADLSALLAERPLPGASWLVLLDGLDEIFEAGSPQQVIEIVNRWWGDLRYRFLLASRPLPEREFRLLQAARIPVFEIQSFTEDQLPLLARGWFRALDVPGPDELTGQFMAQLRQARMAQLARNPLIATMACVVFASAPGRGLSYTRAELYEAFVGLFLEKVVTDGRFFLESVRGRLAQYDPQAAGGADALARDLRSILQTMAYLRFTWTTRSLRTAAETLAAPYRPPAVPPESWNRIAVELIARSGLIFTESDDLTFGHETILEYLAACDWVTSTRSRGLGARERWRLMTEAGGTESYSLFIIELLRDHGPDLADWSPTAVRAVLFAVARLRRRSIAIDDVPVRAALLGRLLHARMIAALMHDGCDLRPKIVAAATERLAEIATSRDKELPDSLTSWFSDDDLCVIAAKALALIDSDRGIDLLFALAADPAVPSFGLVGLSAAVAAIEGLTGMDSAREMSVLYRFALSAGTAGAEGPGELDSAQAIPVLYSFATKPSSGAEYGRAPRKDNKNRLMIATLVLEHDQELGIALLRALADDKSVAMDIRIDCIDQLSSIDHTAAAQVMTGILADPDERLRLIVCCHRRLGELDGTAAAAALVQVARDPRRAAHVRGTASVMLLRAEDPAGAIALREMSADESLPGFHRVQSAAGYRHLEDRASGLLAASRDPTLPGAWRLFAAGEILSLDREQAVEALCALGQDASLGSGERRDARILCAAFDTHRGMRSLIVVVAGTARRLTSPAAGKPAESLPNWIRRYLLHDEWVVCTYRFHVVRLLRPLVILAAGLLAAACLSITDPTEPALAGTWSACGALLLYFSWHLIGWLNGYLVVTDRRLLSAGGALTRTINMMPPGAIRDMQFRCSRIGLILNYGDFSVNNYDTFSINIKCVQSPEIIYAELFDMRIP
jgi:hypothetical protein